MADPPLVGLDPAFDGVLRRDPRDPTRCEYFQDRNKRWPFHCDDDGYGLLSRLLVVATPVVAATQAKIATSRSQVLPSRGNELDRAGGTCNFAVHTYVRDASEAVLDFHPIYPWIPHVLRDASEAVLPSLPQMIIFT